MSCRPCRPCRPFSRFFTRLISLSSAALENRRRGRRQDRDISVDSSQAHASSQCGEMVSKRLAIPIRLSTLDPRSSTLDIRSSTLDPQTPAAPPASPALCSQFLQENYSLPPETTATSYCGFRPRTRACTRPSAKTAWKTKKRGGPRPCAGRPDPRSMTSPGRQTACSSSPAAWTTSPGYTTHTRVG